MGERHRQWSTADGHTSVWRRLSLYTDNCSLHRWADCQTDVSVCSCPYMLTIGGWATAIGHTVICVRFAALTHWPVLTGILMMVKGSDIWRLLPLCLDQYLLGNWWWLEGMLSENCCPYILTSTDWATDDGKGVYCLKLPVLTPWPVLTKLLMHG